jgi:endoglucanase
MRDRILAQTARAAQMLLTRRRSSGYGNTLAAADYIWGSNAVAANQSLLLLAADHLQADGQMREAALGNLHYVLGRNCFGVSWVTLAGTNPFLHPHHRPSIADDIPAPWPGLLSGGPNARPADKVAQTLPRRPPMRMWLDDQLAYSVNEVAINWNAPLVFLLAAANA